MYYYTLSFQVGTDRTQAPYVQLVPKLLLVHWVEEIWSKIRVSQRTLQMNDDILQAQKDSQIFP